MSKKKIRVFIVGVGNCAKSLIQGVDYYIQNPDDSVGLMYKDIGGYGVEDILFVGGADVDYRKAGHKLIDAIYAAPNCAMDHVDEVKHCIKENALVYYAPILDGVAKHMAHYPAEVSFRLHNALLSIETPSTEGFVEVMHDLEVDVIINYAPVGSHQVTDFWIDVAIEVGCNFINCIPTLIDTKKAQEVEQRFIDAGLVIVGSDMRSAWGASRMSEVLQGAMIDAGLQVTQHIQMNMAAGSTQGQEHIRTGRTANTDFLNMADPSRLHHKHVSKENVLKGQNIARNESIAGMTLYAGPSLTVQQKPGGVYIGSDNKIANFDIIAYGFGGSRYEMTARLSVQDSPNSGGVVVSAIRFCQVASDHGIVGYLRGPSAWTQKTPPFQMTSADAKFECDALARGIITPLVAKQYASNNPKSVDLNWTEQSSELDYQ